MKRQRTKPKREREKNRMSKRERERKSGQKLRPIPKKSTKEGKTH